MLTMMHIAHKHKLLILWLLCKMIALNARNLVLCSLSISCNGDDYVVHFVSYISE